MGGRPRRADREDSVRRTVYVSDIDQHVRIFIVFRLVICFPCFILIYWPPFDLQVTEQKLAEVFSTCGQVCYKIYKSTQDHMIFRFIYIRKTKK